MLPKYLSNSNEKNRGPLPCIAHLSAEDTLKSAAIEENIAWKASSLWSLVASLKKNLFNLRIYTHLFMIW